MKYCILDITDNEITAKLNEMGYICIDVIPSDKVSPPICRHSDVLYKKVNSNTIIISSCQKENLPLLEKMGYRVIINEDLKPGYKTECYLNYLINDKYVIYNPATANIPDTYFISGLKHIRVKQGYTGCSTICVTPEAYITDDPGIHKILKDEKLDCLLISKGDIVLPGYDYGFIGGATVKLNEREILFLGDIKNKTDKNNIIAFLGKYNIQPIFIENKNLTDIGSAIIL